ncbi:hypothetical protein [Nonomuraea sp. NPDC002799]
MLDGRFAFLANVNPHLHRLARRARHRAQRPRRGRALGLGEDTLDLVLGGNAQRLHAKSTTSP